MAGIMDEHPEPYIHYPVGKHTHTLILLHGTSQTGPQFAAALLNFEFTCPRPSSSTSTFPEFYPASSLASPQIQAPRDHHIKTTLAKLLPTTKLVFPTGSQKPTTVFGGAITHAWFDIHDFGDRTKGEDDQIRGMRESAGYLDRLVRVERKLLGGNEGDAGDAGRRILGKQSKVALLGFSQGCAMGILMVLSGLLDLDLGTSGSERGESGGGEAIPFIGLSGWLPFRSQIEDSISKKESARAYIRSLLQISPLYTPSSVSRVEQNIFLGHGALDTKVKVEWALQLVDILPRIEGVGIELESKLYEGLAHWFDSKEMCDVVEFLGRIWGLRLEGGGETVGSGT